jgi:phosphoribosyl-AMP cyclohydrolase
MTDERESGLTLNPKYDANGLVTAVITDEADGAVLMVGHMNAEALGNPHSCVFLTQPEAALAKGRKQW